MERDEMDLCGFAQALGHVQGYVYLLLENDEKMVEFAARGVEKADLKNLSEDCQKVAKSFYEVPRPH